MFTLVKERSLRSSMFYGCVMVFFAVFGFVYELFGHEVYSNFMIYAFMIPLFLGVIPYLAVYHYGIRLPDEMFTQLYGGGVMTLTVGSVVKGVLDIYGTTNGKLIVYPAAGLLLIAVGIIALISANRKTVS